MRQPTPINAEAVEAAEQNGSPCAPRSLRSLVALGSCISALVAGAQPAQAQTGWEGRARVSVNAGTQVGTERLAQSITITKYVEPAPLTADQAKAAIPFVDFGVAFRLAGNLGAGLSISYLANKDDAEVTAAIPHPFYFGQPRTISGTVSGVERKELGTHINLVYLIGSPRIDLMLSGGASFFRVDQTFVSDVTFAEIYPYDTASFVDATLVSEHQSKVGYNVGADAIWKFSPQWGLGGLIRYARARIPFTVDDVDAGDVDVGGLQAGAGLRLMF